MEGILGRLNKHQEFIIALILCVFTLVPYWQVEDHNFVLFDDDIYVYNNEDVTRGLTLESIRAAFSLGTPGEQNPYWHPLTTFSHMLDVQLFGLDAGKHHLVNLFFHCSNVILLFFVLRLMSDAPLRSALVALVFALHPVNVDTVAWIAERKNLLSTFFWLLTMLIYYYYCRKPNLSRYLWLVVVFCLGILAKPMLVTLPFVLLLMDYWPLQRISLETQGISPENKPGIFTLLKEKSNEISRLILEKIPLIVLSLVSIYISMLSLKVTGQVGGLTVPLSLRIENAIVSYLHYLYKMVYPANLTFFYPFPKEVPNFYVLISLILIGLFTIAVFTTFRSRKYLTVGWLWYLGTLFPVLGLVQGGLWPQIAERWAYVPFIGMFIVIVWGFHEITSHARFGIFLESFVYLVLVASLGIATFHQVEYWKDNSTFFSRGIELNPKNWVALNNLGIIYLFEKNDSERAEDLFKESLEIQVTHTAYLNLGIIAAQENRPDDAIAYYNQSIRINPGNLDPYMNLGKLTMKLGRLNEAMRAFENARSIAPNNKHVLNGIASVLLERDKPREALEYLTIVLQKDPDFPFALNNLGVAYKKFGKINEAIEQFLAAIKADPNYAEAYNNLAILYQQLGSYDESIDNFLEVVRINPYHEEAQYNLGVLYAKQGNLPAAVDHLRTAVRIDPENGEAHYALALCFSKLGAMDLALYHFREALRINPDDTASKQMMDAFSEKIQSVEQEISQLKVLETKTSDDPRILLNLALKYKEMGDLENSLSYLQKIVAIMPENPDIYYNIACLYSIQNKIDDSLEYLNKAIDKGFSNWKLLHSDPDLENVRQDERFADLIPQDDKEPLASK